MWYLSRHLVVCVGLQFFPCLLLGTLVPLRAALLGVVSTTVKRYFLGVSKLP